MKVILKRNQIVSENKLKRIRQFEKITVRPVHNHFAPSIQMEDVVLGKIVHRKGWKNLKEGSYTYIILPGVHMIAKIKENGIHAKGRKGHLTISLGESEYKVLPHQIKGLWKLTRILSRPIR